MQGLSFPLSDVSWELLLAPSGSGLKHSLRCYPIVEIELLLLLLLLLILYYYLYYYYYNYCLIGTHCISPCKAMAMMKLQAELSKHQHSCIQEAKKAGECIIVRIQRKQNHLVSSQSGEGDLCTCTTTAFHMIQIAKGCFGAAGKQ